MLTLIQLILEFVANELAAEAFCIGAELSREHPMACDTGCTGSCVTEAVDGFWQTPEWDLRVVSYPTGGLVGFIEAPLAPAGALRF